MTLVHLQNSMGSSQSKQHNLRKKATNKYKLYPSQAEDNGGYCTHTHTHTYIYIFYLN